MRHRSSLALVLVSAAALSACHRGRPTTETFIWKGPVKADSWLRLRNTTGDFDVREGTSDSAEIVLEIERSSGYAPSAQVKVLSTDDGVIACVLYGDEGTRCSSEEYKAGRSSGRGGVLPFMHGETKVSGTILLPRGVKLDVSSVNGDVSVASAARDLIVRVVNGDISVRESHGPLDLGTTNGDIDAGVNALSGKARIGTTNGDVSVSLSPSLNAALDMRTVNGELDFGIPGNVITKSKRELVATLGKGGTPVELSTTNGDITIKAAEH
jgi:hypothetical protein